MKYTLVLRGNPRYPERGKKVYACAQYEKRLSLDELLDYIVLHGSALRKGDYKAVISTIALRTELSGRASGLLISFRL